ncbi:MAG: hypothetical protein JNK46_12790 [Methylobacteriaceae bacterium]|nr:hypothetical protein [Methylobacteriaceae bacterium]
MTARFPLSGPILTLAAALALAASPALALDDGKESLIDTFAGIISFGAQKPAPEIDYRERAPLVLPPKGANQLRQPVERAERGPAWPVDPDVQRRKEAAAKAKLPFDTGDKVMLTKRELMGGRAAGAESLRTAPDNPGCRMQGGSCLWVNPDALRSQGYAPEKQDKVVAGQEPDRAWLTQPPKGYRKATQSAGVGKQSVAREDDDANPLSYFLRPFRGKSDDD